ncbi:hypothetical protein HID58_085899 [Brassica napus]|uniref:MD-2-related lipid-recognition domain-containing protein n=1 Tax=Brassica napus TaxID=3708 RepID=A0ABQ7XRD8_BRANA|nr:hypothetical protein HID58_085899 [Brassica napus]
MAIPHVYPMFLLILSLFCLPTLLAIPFQDCGWGDYPIKVTGVEVFEKQNKASLNITGSTSTLLIPFIICLIAIEEKMRVSISVNDPDHEEIMCLYFNYDTSSTGVVFA